MPALASRPVKAALVNWLPWSVLKISGLPKCASASSSASTQCGDETEERKRHGEVCSPVDDRGNALSVTENVEG